MYKLKLATRYFLRRPISILAVAAVALSVFIVVVVMTVMNGLVNEFRHKNHAFVGDCIISTDSLVGFPYYEEFVAELKQLEAVEAVSATIRSFGLLTQPGATWNMGIEIMGVDPVDHAGATGFEDTLYYHRNTPQTAFVPPYHPAALGCIVGIDMMPQSRTPTGDYYHPEEPRQFELIISCFPLTIKGATGDELGMVNTKNFFYSDDSHSGLVKVDGNMIYIPFEYAQLMCGMKDPVPRASALHVRFVNTEALEQNCAAVRTLWNNFVEQKKDAPYANLLNNVRVETWIVNRRSHIAPMEKEQTMLILLFLMLGLITVFVIFVVFYMIVSHKSKDIGILRSIGVSSMGVVQVFVCFAALVGIVGAAIGGAAACGLLVYVNDLEDWLFAKYNWQLWDRSVYAIGDIPNNIEPHVVGLIILSAVAASILGALPPSVQATRKRPVEILQVNQL
ncbi:MAG TPA: FtsX-like permease family protein [Anaerohalosphaeraceae bacterium]|jgi:lipoprotein-releasing system permease protein|nr:FtsX-like permease family protein [Anaerohalosphaeraceae bacterium]HRT51041.1 FtsX-like permease family protein [Anaerohalosphaeraceae bacterium]HRT87027.1 FtsX-like permease family protein [Anaerohalosphaeraceae bacterium]